MVYPPLKPVATFAHGRIRVVLGDITDQSVGAVVNAANATLLGGGGVDGAIHRRGGTAILAECSEIRRTRFPSGLPVGEAVITTGGSLAAPYVIHTVGPIYGRHSGLEPGLLASCYRNSLELAALHRVETIAFPSISTGAFGYPKAEAALVSSDAIAGFLETDISIREVRLVFFLGRDANTFLKNHTFAP